MILRNKNRAVMRKNTMQPCGMIFGIGQIFKKFFKTMLTDDICRAMIVSSDDITTHDTTTADITSARITQRRIHYEKQITDNRLINGGGCYCGLSRQ